MEMVLLQSSTTVVSLGELTFRLEKRDVSEKRKADEHGRSTGNEKTGHNEHSNSEVVVVRGDSLLSIHGSLALSLSHSSDCRLPHLCNHRALAISR